MWPGGSRVPNLVLSDHASLLWGTSWLPGAGPSIPLSPAAIPSSLFLSGVAACQSSHRVLAKGASWCLHLNRDPSLKSDNEARAAVRADSGPAHSCRCFFTSHPEDTKSLHLLRRPISPLVTAQTAPFSLAFCRDCLCSWGQERVYLSARPGILRISHPRVPSTAKRDAGSQDCSLLSELPALSPLPPPRWASNDLLWASYLPTTMQSKLEASLH